MMMMIMIMMMIMMILIDRKIKTSLGLQGGPNKYASSELSLNCIEN